MTILDIILILSKPSEGHLSDSFFLCIVFSLICLSVFQVILKIKSKKHMAAWRQSLISDSLPNYATLHDTIKLYGESAIPLELQMHRKQTKKSHLLNVI